MRPLILIFLIAVMPPAIGQEVRRALPVSAQAEDELAKFLAGVSLPEESPLSALQKTRDYAAHVAQFARLTRHFDANYFSRMRAWSAAELEIGRASCRERV